ncbi:MAG: hypothetical protein LBT55_03660 [Clostridiaceae bacterium]|jgi:hypothetical protein|nr:hypothetical protein [Clostridiaceae bacterium]
MDKNGTIYKYWFSKNAKQINIVTSRVNEPPPWAFVYSKDYSYFDQFGDKDLVYKVSVFLSKYYPNAQIKYFVSDDFERQRGVIGENTLIIGGPRWNNKVCQDYMWDTKIKSIFRYPPFKDSKKEICSDCEKVANDCGRECICVNKKIISYIGTEVLVHAQEVQAAKIAAERCTSLGNGDVMVKDCVKTDYGFFATFNNDNNYDKSASRVVILNGIHIFGGLGAFYAFNDSPNAQKNYTTVQSELGYDNTEFFAYMPIQVAIKNTVAPIGQIEITRENIFSYRKAEKCIDEATTSTTNLNELATAEIAQALLLDFIKKIKDIENDPNYGYLNPKSLLDTLVDIYSRLRNTETVQYALEEYNKLSPQLEEVKNVIA